MYPEDFAKRVREANPEDKFMSRSLKEGSLELGRMLKMRAAMSIENLRLYREWRKLYHEFTSKNRVEVC